MSTDHGPDLRPSYLEHRARRVDPDRLTDLAAAAQPFGADRLAGLAAWYTRFEQAVTTITPRKRPWSTRSPSHALHDRDAPGSALPVSWDVAIDHLDSSSSRDHTPPHTHGSTEHRPAHPDKEQPS